MHLNKAGDILGGVVALGLCSNSHVVDFSIFFLDPKIGIRILNLGSPKFSVMRLGALVGIATLLSFVLWVRIPFGGRQLVGSHENRRVPSPMPPP